MVSWYRKVGVNCEITDQGDSAVQVNNQLLAAVKFGDSMVALNLSADILGSYGC